MPLGSSSSNFASTSSLFVLSSSFSRVINLLSKQGGHEGSFEATHMTHRSFVSFKTDSDTGMCTFTPDVSSIDVIKSRRMLGSSSVLRCTSNCSVTMNGKCHNEWQYQHNIECSSNNPRIGECMHDCVCIMHILTSSISPAVYKGAFET